MDYLWLAVTIILILASNVSAYRAGAHSRGAQMYAALMAALNNCETKWPQKGDAWRWGVLDFNIEFRRLAEERGL